MFSHFFRGTGLCLVAKPRSPGRLSSRCRRGLRFEPLEQRRLLDAAGLPPGTSGDTLLEDFARFDSAAQLEQYLIEDALERYGDWFGQPGPQYSIYYDYRVLGDGVMPAEAFSSLSGGSAVNETGHSETNTQVEGVDEGDVVETDGEYLYVLSGQQIVILDVLSDQGLHVASRMEIDGQPFQQYLNGDRLTVLSRTPDYCWSQEPVLAMDLAVDCLPQQPALPTVTVTVFDVSDRETPRLVQETELDGRFVDSRAIGDLVYLVLGGGFYLPPPQCNPLPDAAQEGTEDVDDESLTAARWMMPVDPGTQCVYETQEEYLARIGGQVLDLALPHFSSYGPDGELVESGLVSEATDVYRPLSGEDDNLISVAVFDMGGDGPGAVWSTSVPTGSTTEVYMSSESLYLLQSRWWYAETGGGEETSILRFDLDPDNGRVDLAAAGVAPGRVLNQFSVDEYDGYLRMATTQRWSGFWIDRGAPQNGVYVLRQTGTSLEVVGSLENLAPGEEIYSARFLGEKAFVVTYRMVDPLFAIDLSVPAEPRLAGELKVPGFSNYLHAVEGDYLIGVGRNADERTGLFEDPQISLFDVGDLGNPQLLDRFTIDTGRAGGLNIFDDHHAIAYFPEYRVLTVAIPAADPWEGNGVIGFWCTVPKTEMWVFQVDPDGEADTETGGGEIRLLGQIKHDTAVRRGVRIGELLYSVSEDTVTAHEILDPDVPVGEVHFGVQELGPVEFLGLSGLDLSAGDRWYRFQTKRQGTLTLEATGTEPVEVELYDATGEPLNAPAGERIDWQVDAGQTYGLRVGGTGQHAEVRLANAVQRDGDRVTAFGTQAGDRFEFDAATSTLVLNGVEYRFDDVEIASVTFDGGQGSDVVVLRGTAGDETAELGPGQGTLRGESCTVALSQVETVTVYGGGGRDTATLHDSAGDDELVQWPAGSLLGGQGFRNKVHDFATVCARSTAGGKDVGKVYDSPGNDELLTKPGFARLSGDGFVKQAEGFYAMHGFATAGGVDVARMYDSAEDDLFSANSIAGALFGAGFYNRAKFFEAVHAYATAGGIDTAKLFDSPGDDTFHADPLQGALFGAGFYLRAKHFEGCHAYATGGGHDVARLLDSAEDDVFYADHEHGALYRPGRFYNRAKHFEEVYAEATAGDDQARLNDSALDDLLEADENWARLSNLDLDFICEISQFDRVKTAAAPAAGRSRIAPQLHFILEPGGSW